jgi:hypothetical protein
VVLTEEFIEQGFLISNRLEELRGNVLQHHVVVVALELLQLRAICGIELLVVAMQVEVLIDQIRNLLDTFVLDVLVSRVIVDKGCACETLRVEVEDHIDRVN